MADAEQVKKDVKNFFRSRKVRYIDLASILGYKYAQSITNIFNSKKYFSRRQAELLCSNYPELDYNYLTTGEGILIKKINLPECEIVNGKSKDLFYRSLFEVFRLCASFLQNQNLAEIYNEMHRLAQALNMSEKLGIKSEEEIIGIFKQTEIFVNNLLDKIESENLGQ